MKKVFIEMLERHGRVCWVIADRLHETNHLRLALYFIKEARKCFEYAAYLKR